MFERFQTNQKREKERRKKSRLHLIETKKKRFFLESRIDLINFTNWEKERLYFYVGRSIKAKTSSIYPTCDELNCMTKKSRVYIIDRNRDIRNSGKCLSYYSLTSATYR